MCGCAHKLQQHYQLTENNNNSLKVYFNNPVPFYQTTKQFTVMQKIGGNEFQKDWSFKAIFSFVYQLSAGIIISNLFNFYNRNVALCERKCNWRTSYVVNHSYCLSVAQQLFLTYLQGWCFQNRCSDFLNIAIFSAPSFTMAMKMTSLSCFYHQALGLYFY